jgi:nicotinic acid phosphoribosyltransferase
MKKKSEITTLLIGTHLATYQNQPAFGWDYILVAIHSKPRVKLSNEAAKPTLPSKIDLFRLYDETRKEIYSGLKTKKLNLQRIFKFCKFSNNRR